MVCNNLIKQCNNFLNYWPKSYVETKLKVKENGTLDFFLEDQLLQKVSFDSQSVYKYKDRTISRKDLGKLCSKLSEKILVTEKNESDILFIITAKCQLLHYINNKNFFEEQKMKILSFILADKFPSILNFKLMNREQISVLINSMTNYLKSLKPQGLGIKIKNMQYFKYFNIYKNQSLFSELENNEYKTDNITSYNFLLDLIFFSQLV